MDHHGPGRWWTIETTAEFQGTTYGALKRGRGGSGEGTRTVGCHGQRALLAVGSMGRWADGVAESSMQDAKIQGCQCQFASCQLPMNNANPTVGGAGTETGIRIRTIFHRLGLLGKLHSCELARSMGRHDNCLFFRFLQHDAMGNATQRNATHCTAARPMKCCCGQHGHDGTGVTAPGGGVWWGRGLDGFSDGWLTVGWLG